LKTWQGDGVDTFAGTVTKDLVPLPDTTAPLQLTADELESIRHKVVETRFFELPETLVRGESSWEPGRGGVLLQVYVRMGRKTRTVTLRGMTERDIEKLDLERRGIKFRDWSDQGTPADQARRRLRALAEHIMAIVRARDEFRALPKAKGGYV
jgi:hypothetical protein